MRLRIPNMSREIATRTDAEIERETALKWAGRAVAAMQRATRTRNETQAGALVLRAWTYRHEAIEHAAAIEDNGRTLAILQRQLDRVMLRSAKKLEGRYGRR